MTKSKNCTRPLRSQLGFSLIEVMLVLVICVGLSASLIGGAFHRQQQYEERRDGGQKNVSELREIAKRKKSTREGSIDTPSVINYDSSQSVQSDFERQEAEVYPLSDLDSAHYEVNSDDYNPPSSHGSWQDSDYRSDDYVIEVFNK
ncbi:prepilin-type N-terminal cleavage/methylation domain-containing protein [Vibrio crassostreae]|uniref:prepilin-type N-terminal cleavage/methylation domain-containing protein n=1 Tax=Vibrio crassostreae TaxID=246167 RepID=UPI001B30C9F7